MTKQETVKVMAMLSAFYGMGKSNPEAMANAWHLILKDYEFKDAETAVVKYAKQDRRDYAAFPPPGKIVELIEHEAGRYNRLFNSMYQQIPYDNIGDLQELCDSALYERGLHMETEELLSKRVEFIDYIRKQETKLLQ